MKINYINEASSDNRKAILKALEKEINKAKKIAGDELVGVVPDPEGLLRHILRGMKNTKLSLVDDDTYWIQMAQYWPHIDRQFLKNTHLAVLSDAVEKLEKASNAGIAVEGLIRGFLSALGKIAALFVMLAFNSGGMGAGSRLDRLRDRGQDGRNRSGRERPLPGAPEQGQQPEDGEELSFEIVRMNPYMVYNFVKLCIDETNRMIKDGEMQPFTDDDEPGDLRDETPLPDEEPFNSGETVEYPEI